MHASGILSMFSDQNQHMQLARSAATPTLVGKQYLNPGDLHMRAHEKSLAMLDAISREAEKVERRKDKIHKQLYERRATLAAMGKSLLARRGAETITMPYEPGPR